MGSTPRRLIDRIGTGRLGPRVRERPGLLERLLDEGTESGRGFPETDGYGPRDPAADDVPRAAWESARLGARLE